MARSLVLRVEKEDSAKICPATLLACGLPQSDACPRISVNLAVQWVSSYCSHSNCSCCSVKQM